MASKEVRPRKKKPKSQRTFLPVSRDGSTLGSLSSPRDSALSYLPRNSTRRDLKSEPAKHASMFVYIRPIVVHVRAGLVFGRNVIQLKPEPNEETPPLSTVAVGSEIYLIGGIYEELPSSSVRIFDCRSHTWRDGPNMTVARNDAHAVLLDEKIYVVGGIGKYSTNWFEVFDIKTQSWTALPIPDDELRDHTGDELACVVQGNIYIMAHTRVYTYEPRQGTWKSTARETRSYELVYVSCVIENALYSCCEEGYCHWYDFKGGEWKVIKGLEELREHRTRGLRGDRVLEVANHGGNLLVFWDAGTKLTKRKIWYAKISLETRCNGNEVCGKVEWADFLLTSYDFYHCASVSV